MSVNGLLADECSYTSVMGIWRGPYSGLEYKYILTLLPLQLDISYPCSWKRDLQSWTLATLSMNALNIHGQLQHELRSFTAFRHLQCINNTELLSATEMTVLNYNLYSCCTTQCLWNSLCIYLNRQTCCYLLKYLPRITFTFKYMKSH
jgi:hypothetical protein